jgi:acyl dehydratase
MPVARIESIAQLREYVGREVAVSDWLDITQERINLFADVTEDWQWIHVDPELAAEESPFKTTVAHGFLTLSLLSRMAKLAISIDGLKMGINYGLNRVRFISPVPAGARIRGRFLLAALVELREGVQATWEVTIERDGGDKPCCMAEWLARYY